METMQSPLCKGAKVARILRARDLASFGWSVTIGGATSDIPRHQKTRQSRKKVDLTTVRMPLLTHALTGLCTATLHTNSEEKLWREAVDMAEPAQHCC